jgi:hypothetical protein
VLRRRLRQRLFFAELEREAVLAIGETMLTHMTDEDRALDALWRERFGEPLPILGAAEAIRLILARSDERVEAEEAA